MYNANDLKCAKALPAFIPASVSSVTAHEVPLEPYMNFTYTDWHSVTHLSVSLGSVVNETEILPLRTLQDYKLTGLSHLHHLKLLCNCDLLVEESAFQGLINVCALDLSNNVLRSRVLYNILSGLKGENSIKYF